MAAHLARARLGHGECLRRENWRAEARDQVRPAFGAFASMGQESRGCGQPPGCEPGLGT